MRRTTLPAATVCTLVAALAVAPARAAPGDEDVLRRARAAFDDALHPDRDGRSVNAAVRELMSFGPIVVRKVEAEAWERSRHGFQVEYLMRFLHGLEPRPDCGHERPGPSRYDLVAGAVVWRQGYCYGHKGPGKRRLVESFEEFVGNVPVRDLPAIEAIALLEAACLESAPGKGEPISLFEALGEACGHDDAGLAALVARYDATPDHDGLTTALGWSGRTDVVERLVAKCRRLATSPGEELGSWPTPAPATTAARALRHADSGALEKLFDALPIAAGDRLAAFLGEDVLVHRRLATVDAASDPVLRRAALRRLCDLDAIQATGRYGGRMPTGADATRLLHALRDALDSNDSGLRSDALEAVDWFLSRPAACAQTALRRLAEDVDAGRVVFCAPAPDEKTPAVAKLEDCAVVASVVPAGLRLRITNVSDHALALNTTALRHAVGLRRTSDGNCRRNGEELELRFGCPAYCAAFGPSAFVVLPPRAVHEVVVPLRGEFCGARRVVLSLEPQRVLGEAPAPLAWFRVAQDL